jgi:lipopolysaccharide biosynthesis glycosyltransferase
VFERADVLSAEGPRAGSAKEVNLAVALDRNVAWGCAVAVRSALENSTPGTVFNIYVVHDDLPEAVQARLAESWDTADRQVQIFFIAVDLANATDLVRSRTLSRMSYARLLLGEALPSSVERCLYIDTDMLFELDVAELFAEDLKGKIVAAVPDGSEEWDREQLSRLGVESDHYFNAGLLLIDVVRWRSARVGVRALEYCRRARPELVGPFRFGSFFWDQDALNYVLAGQVLSLPSRWNTWAVNLNEYMPVVIHLITGPKPWDSDYAGRFSSQFFAYLDRTTFRGQRPTRLLGVAPFVKRLSRRVPYPPTIIRLLRETLKGYVRH